MNSFDIHAKFCNHGMCFDLERCILDYKKVHGNYFVPYLNLPNDCEMMFTPTYLAQARFMIRRKANPSVVASVYLDIFDNLGCIGEPYWEVWSERINETWRYVMKDVDALMVKVVEILDCVEKPDIED